ncbi:hypothetical protein CC80DRAFT_539156 [Byssothecium circinans]|uniref:Uncharacterized protein n=1 Tax=Byssothecium circinans TaxID=147558 RepID=A0A6A5TJL3_9PLEO|nr:hypothetical protein CC80DRAFT_539156 [Byssothecium circinans]
MHTFRQCTYNHTGAPIPKSPTRNLPVFASPSTFERQTDPKLTPQLSTPTPAPPSTPQPAPCLFTATPTINCGDALGQYLMCLQCCTKHAFFLSQAALNLKDHKAMRPVEEMRDMRPHYYLTAEYLGFTPSSQGTMAACKAVVSPETFCVDCTPLAQQAGVCDENGVVRPHCALSDHSHCIVPFQKAWKPSEGCTRAREADTICDACFADVSARVEKSEKDREIWETWFVDGGRKVHPEVLG